MKIAILVTGFPPRYIGGTETQAYNLAKNLGKKHRVVVLTRSCRGLPREERGDGFLIRRFWYLDMPVIRFFSHILSSLNEIRKLRRDIDILQCMMLTPNGLVGVLARKLFGIRAAAWTRSDYKYSIKRNSITKLITRFVLRNLNITLVQTRSIRKEVLEDFPDLNVKTVPNGVYMEKDRAHGNKIVFVGNLTERKGLEYLMPALRRLEHDAEVLIVGDGPERKKLEGMSRGLNVSFAGRVLPHEVKGYMRDGKVFVLPSVGGRGEGLPNVILEAMSLGLPVVATRIAGIPDVIEHGRTGFLAEPKSPGQIAMYLNRLLENEDLRREMGRNCLREVNKYSWERIIKRLEKIYMEVK